MTGNKPPTRSLTFTRNLGLLIFVSLFCSPFVIIGFRLAATSFAAARKARASTHWQPTPARVRTCQVRVEKDSDGDPTYEVDVHYSYVFAGVERDSRTLSHGNLALGGKAGCEALCARLLSNPT